MEIDSYQQCPCQSGKKIKFCCGKDLVNDLNQVLSKHGAGQSIAAVEQIDRIINKAGPRDCLLTIKTHILITLGEIEKARQSNQQFLQKSPGHVTGLHHRALIELAEGKLFEAVDSLQDSVDAIAGNEIPLSLANAFRVVGIGLLTNGHLLAGRAHLAFALELKNGQDDDLKMLLSQTFRSAEVPLLLKNDFRLAQPPAEDTLWYKKYVNVTRALARGQFRKALKFLNQIDEKFPDQLKVVRGIALVRSFLGHPEGLIDKWRCWSRHPEMHQLDAVETEAIAQTLDPQPPAGELNLVRLTFEIENAQQVGEQLFSSTRLKADKSLANADPFGEGPPPRNMFYLLDRDAVMSADGLTADRVPMVVGEVLLFGKQTDREARVDIVAVEDDRFDDAIAEVRDLLAGQSSGDPRREVMDTVDCEQHALSWVAAWPDDISRSQHEGLLKDAFPGMLDRWSRLNFGVLGNKSVRDVVGDDEFRISLHGLCCCLLTSVERKYPQQMLRPFLDELQIPQPEPIPADALREREISPFQQRYLDFSGLPDEDLVFVHQHAMMIANVPVVRLVLDEILGRDDFDAIPRYLTLALAARLTEGDDEKMLRLLEEARAEARQQGQPVGLLLVQEFELRLLRGMTEKLPALLQNIQLHHLEEPEVEYELVRVLQQHGLVDGELPTDGPPAAPSPHVMAEAGSPPAPGGFIVDDAAAVSSTQDPSKLWLPE